MAELHVSYQVPLPGNGRLELEIDVQDVLALGDGDREFLLAVLQTTAQLRPVAAAGPPVPDVLRGVTGGRRT